jgi:hypothetical protein
MPHIARLLERRGTLMKIMSLIRIEKALIIRAGHHAGPAPYTFIFIDINNAVGVPEGSTRGTDILARRLRAVVALEWD